MSTLHDPKMKTFSTLSLLLVAFLECSCSTVVSRGFGGTGHLYPATRVNAAVIAEPFGVDASEDEDADSVSQSVFTSSLMLLDLPFSFVSDSVLLPLDLIILSERSRENKK